MVAGRCVRVGVPLLDPSKHTLHKGESDVGWFLPRPPSRGPPPTPVSGGRSAPSHTPAGPPANVEASGPALLEDLLRSTGFNYISQTVPRITGADGGGFKHNMELKLEDSPLSEW